MQYVRCDACGAKALFAASRCPKCAHPFYLRDHRGEMVDLSHCRKCDTYYLRSVGGCKWCGTPAVSGSRGAKAAGLAGLVVLALAALVYFQFIRTDQAPPARASDSSEANATQVVLPQPAQNAVLDSGTIDRALLATMDTAPVPDLVSPAAPTAPVVAPPPLRSSTPVVWVRATALTYINVRSAADRKAPVVGVVTPTMNVELGARHLGWRQVRAPGVTGWADPRNFALEGVGTPR